jgi:transposase InsO family protein
MPRIGGRKLYRLLLPDFDRLGYKLGRDRFFDLLKAENLLIIRRKRKRPTTDSAHGFHVYENLLLDLEVCRPYQALVADITYLRVADGFCYLSLVTDLFSRFIVGWNLSPTLEATGPLAALRMALPTIGSTRRCIHHSDRGVQYCCNEYVQLLFRAKMRISMCWVGSPEQNAVAERVNGILKEEFLLDQQFPNFHLAFAATKEGVHTYNHLRPHTSLEYETPATFLKEYKSRR